MGLHNDFFLLWGFSIDAWMNTNLIPQQGRWFLATLGIRL